MSKFTSRIARSTLPASVLALMLAGAPAAVQAQDLVGTWELTVENPQGSASSTLSFTMMDGELKGELRTARRGRAGGDGREMTMAISEIEVEGDSFSFVASMSMGQRSLAMSYSGTISGDEMEGTIQGPRGDPRAFTGKRKTD